MGNLLQKLTVDISINIENLEKKGEKMCRMICMYVN